MRNIRSGSSAIRAALCALTVTVVGVASAEQTAKLSGEDLYAEYCGSCHDQVSARIPSREALTQMSAARILRTLDFGLMMSIAYPLRRDEREAVAKFLGTGTDEFTPPPSAFCTDREILSGPEAESWTGWGPSSANTRFQTAERESLAWLDTYLGPTRGSVRAVTPIMAHQDWVDRARDGPPRRSELSCFLQMAASNPGCLRGDG